MSNFYYVYILSSIPKEFIYVGFTSDLKRRVQEHNSGSEFSTKPFIPFELIHYEAYRNEKDAKRREEYFKTTKGKTTLRMMLQEYFSSFKKDLSQKPPDAMVCPICQGTRLAPTKSFFTRSGVRTSGMVAICLTCKGKGWITKQQVKEVNESL